MKYLQQEAFYTARHWLTQLWTCVPFLLSVAVFLTIITWKSPVMLFCLLIGTVATLVLEQIGRNTRLSKYSVIISQIAFVAILSFFWIDHFADPAAAQFFGRAESFFKNNFQGAEGGGAQAAVSLIFNVLRAIYLLYIAVSLIGVINAVRKDEDWQSIARTPLLVVVAVTIADVLTGFIIGNTNP